MYTTAKGYIVPVLLIVVLLVTAGYFVFVGAPVETPEQLADADTAVRATTTRQTPVAPSGQSDDAAEQVGDTADMDEDVGDSVATSTASTTLDVEADLE